MEPVKRKRKKRLIKLIIVFLIVIGLILAVYFITTKEKMPARKILVIGIDAIDPKVVNKLMEAGKLPNFEKLKEAGTYSELQTTIPPETPVAWSAVATGSNPGKYAIFDFINRDPVNYLPKLNLARQKSSSVYECAMRGLPFWEITTSKGISTTVIRWPVTFPATKVKGKMLSGLGVVDIKGFLNSYRFYTSGDYDKKSEGAEKIISIVKEGSKINTNLFGPFTMKGKERIEIDTPIEITLEDDKAIILVDGKKYEVKVGGWSDWIRVKFKIGFMKEVYGILKVYLLSTEPDFNMYATSIQIDPENPLVEITYPKNYAKELVKEIGLFYTLGMPEDTKAVTENRISKDIFFEQIKQIENEREKMFWYEFDKFKEGIFAFGFDAGDRLQHIFWEDKVLEDDGFKIAKEIEEYYIAKDKFLGQVLDRLEGTNISLIIFSDHGFNSFERAVDINTWLVENNYMTLTKELDEFEEGDEGGLFKYVDWSKTKAYSLGFASIYINLKGRESKGIIEEGDKDNLVEKIIETLGKLTDSKTGGKVIMHLYKREEAYSGKFIDEAPDIVIGFREGYRMSWQTAIGGLSSEVIKDNEGEWTGDHLMDRSYVPGVIFTNFKIKKENPGLIDIAPTVLSLLDLEIPEEMDGKSLV